MARVPRRPQTETTADETTEEARREEAEERAEEAPARRPLRAPTSTPETRRTAREERANEQAGGGPNVFPSGDEGERVVAISAECLYTPKQYTSFRVGPFTFETRVRAGETAADALRRAQRVVDKIHDEAFEATLARFVGESRKAEGAMR